MFEIEDGCDRLQGTELEGSAAFFWAPEVAVGTEAKLYQRLYPSEDMTITYCPD